MTGMTIKTFQELKAENKKKLEQVENVEQTEQVENVEQTEQVENVEQTEQVENVEQTEQVENVEQNEQTEQAEETENQQDSEYDAPWKKTDDHPQTVPLQKHIKVRSKLKSEVNDKNEVIEQLKKENENLKNSTVNNGLKKPRKEDFYSCDDPDEAYSDAMIDYKFNLMTAKQEEAKREEQRKIYLEKVEEEVNQHYERCERLINEENIPSEKFINSVKRLKESVENVFPQQGENIVNDLFSSLGEGSEKVMYFLGNNQAALNEFNQILFNDKSGLKAAAFLGAKKAEFQRSVSHKKQRLSPPPNIKGDASISSSKKSYDKANDIGDRIRIKREAKRRGIDTSSW